MRNVRTTYAVSSRGQLTIPLPIRRALGLKGGEQFLVTDHSGDLVFTLLRSTRRAKKSMGFAAVFRRLLNRGLSEQREEAPHV